MPITFPIIDRGPDWNSPESITQRIAGVDITNLSVIGVEFDSNSLANGFPIDFNAGRAVNLRNLGTFYEHGGGNPQLNPVPAPIVNNRFSFLQTDWAASNRAITGISRDSSGAVLANCIVHLFITGSDAFVAEKTSDASGAFSFGNPGTGPFYLVAYKAGSPDVAGTTKNTIIPDLI